MINHRVQKYIEDHSLGDKYISHDLVPSFYLADEQIPVCRGEMRVYTQISSSMWRGKI